MFYVYISPNDTNTAHYNIDGLLSNTTTIRLPSSTGAAITTYAFVKKGDVLTLLSSSNIKRVSMIYVAFE